jgi:hypothetical protein
MLKSKHKEDKTRSCCMKNKIITGITLHALKSCIFICLAGISLTVFAFYPYYPNSYDDTLYLGNPIRPNTIWVPARCENGCMAGGHYVKFLYAPQSKRDVYWLDSTNDSYGNYIPAHWAIRGARE